MEHTTTKIITPSAGICNAIPDIISPDNQLQDCINLTYHDEALRPIQDTVKTIEHQGKLLHVHNLNSGDTVHIYFEETETEGNVTRKIISDINKQGVSNVIMSSVDGTPHVTSIGNTLVISDNNGLHYALWKPAQDEYKYLGQSIPEYNIQFHLTRQDKEGETDCYDTKTDRVSSYLRTDQAYEGGSSGFFGDTTGENIKVKAEGLTVISDALIGLYAKNKTKIANKKAFHSPFFVITAIELYDGSYTLHSAPVLLMPCTKSNSYVYFSTGNNIYFKTFFSYLNYKLDADYSEWKDIVKNIIVFASPQIEVFDTDCIINNAEEESDNDEKFYTFNPMNYNSGTKVCSDINTISPCYKEQKVKLDAFSYNNTLKRYCIPFDLRSSSEIINDVKSTSTFFKIAELGTSSKQGLINEYIKDKVLENLTSQLALTNVDYFSHCPLYPQSMNTFNRRLNLTGAKRGFFKGFSQFMSNQYGNDKMYKYEITVQIEIPDGTKTVTHNFYSVDYLDGNSWLYYPDPRAKKISLKREENQLLNNVDLKEHTGLNGAYHIGTTLPTEEIVLPAVYQQSDLGQNSDTATLPPPETLPNYLLQSEVDNPFTFTASGYIRVGQGNIIGIAALTTALNSDAYKIATTIVFTTQGIWAVKINDQGQYVSVAPPFSREVCINPDTITMVDNGIFFVSEKGLMLIDDNGCRCVSTQLNGKNNADFGSFISFARNCRMAYDYRDSQIWLINNETATVASGSAAQNADVESGSAAPTYKYNYHWLYNMLTGTLSRKQDNRHYISIVTDYPDTLLQHGNDIYSMLSEPNINDDTNTYSASFVTRPLKFEASLQMKSIRQILHLMDINDNATLNLTMQVSNDCKHWATQNSVGGRGYKYFRFKYVFTNLKATDTFCASALTYTTSEVNKIR